MGQERLPLSVEDEDRLEEFREYLIGLGFSPATVRNYVMRMKQAFTWAAHTGTDLLDLRPSEASDLAQTVPRSNASQRQLRVTVQHYWDLHGVEGPAKAFRVPPRPTPRWKGLNDDQVIALKETARPDWPRGGVIYLALYLGLRREEIATLRWNDFEPDLSWVRIMGKGERTRFLPVHPNLQRKLAAARWPGEYVFPGRLGGHITPATINNWVAQMGELAGIGHLHPHQLRHTAGGKVNDATRDIYAAQGWLGHAQVQTTEVYSHLSSKRLVEAMHTFDEWGTDDPGEPAAGGSANVVPFVKPGSWQPDLPDEIGERQ